MKFESSDVPRRQLEELVAERPERAREIPPGAYSRAGGLHELVDSIEREFGGVSA